MHAFPRHALCRGGRYHQHAHRLLSRTSLPPLLFRRPLASSSPQASTGAIDVSRLRNIGISAHIDSGKTTLTERILFYTGRIKEIHEVKGKDGVGATMDSMELERERGITIQSAATFVAWKDCHLNIIDTPGHVDFTIEVERALRVLDGAVLVLCGVAGVQSQSMTVDRQMRRYNVPRITFVNKLDRGGANPWKPIDDVRRVLGMRVAAMQVPIGEEDKFEGLVDLLRMKAVYYEGPAGAQIVERDIPESMIKLVNEKRRELVETLADVDDEIGELFLMEEEPTAEQLEAAVRRATLKQTFSPVYMGSAFKNKGVQSLLDAVVKYLPNPNEMTNVALDLNNEEQPVKLTPDPMAPLVALAFKLEQGRFGQLTYMRVYQGSLKKGTFIQNATADKRVRIPRLVRVHSNVIEDVDEVPAGEVAATFGLDCDSGDTFTDPSIRYSMTSMHVPDPVISLAVSPVRKQDSGKFAKALDRFVKEDPTFRRHTDVETGQTIISGMGELHLDIYVERMKREYEVDGVNVGHPRVHYRETVTQRVDFKYMHRKQSGGRGQYGLVIGWVEPLDDPSAPAVFDNEIHGGTIPHEFHPALQKGFDEVITQGVISGHRVLGTRLVINDGGFHAVDSSELAFRLATATGFREAFKKARPQILEPIMTVEIMVPSEYQAAVTSTVNRKRGFILDAIQRDQFTTLRAEIPLKDMFGYSTELRSATQGKGEFTMEYKEHAPVTQEHQARLIAEFEEERAKRNA